MDKTGTYAVVILAAVALVALVGVVALATEPAWNANDENAAGFAKKTEGAKKSKSASNDNENRMFNSGG